MKVGEITWNEHISLAIENEKINTVSEKEWKQKMAELFYQEEGPKEGRNLPRVMSKEINTFDTGCGSIPGKN